MNIPGRPENKGQNPFVATHEIVPVTDTLGFAYKGWGNPFSNADLVKQFPTIPNAATMIADTRIVRRHYPYTGSEPFLERRVEIGEKMTVKGAEVLTEALGTGRLGGLDLLVVSSSLPPDSTGEWGRAIVNRSMLGNTVDIRFSYMACAGAGAALLDVLSQGYPADTRVGIVAVEPLGYALGD